VRASKVAKRAICISIKSRISIANNCRVIIGGVGNSSIGKTGTWFWAKTISATEAA
jgi:hypothetical protein